MAPTATSIIEEDETFNNDQYDYDRVQFNISEPANASLIKNQDEPLSQMTTMKTYVFCLFFKREHSILWREQT